MAEKFNEDIDADLRTQLRAIQVKLNALDEYRRNKTKYKTDELATLKASVSSDSEWKGNAKP